MTERKIGVVGVPGKWSTEILADAVEARTGYRLVIDMNEARLDLSRNRLFYRDHDLSELDGLMVKKISAEYSPNTLDRLELLRSAENSGVQVFSGAENMIRLINRLSCTITLRNANIPMPDTVITESVDIALATVKRFGSAVFKPLFSTKARGMCIIDADQAEQTIRDQIDAFRRDNAMIYMQRKLDLPGRDLGMVFLGGQYLGAYARVRQGDSWNTTIDSGGKYAGFTPPQSMIDLAQRAQAPFNMDFTTVDVAETASGPIVFEVSAFGGFRGALDGAGIDVASLYTDYVLDKLA